MNQLDSTEKLALFWTFCCGWWITLIGGFTLYAALSEPRSIGETISGVAIGLFFLIIGTVPYIWLRRSTGRRRK
jgi:hypothetical protein